MLGWFGRKSAPETRPLVPVWLQDEAEAGQFVRGYQAQLDEVYRRNPVGLRAVRLVASLTGALPLFVEEGDGQAAELVQRNRLLEQAAAALLLHGNAYIRLVADGYDRPAELHPMRPERVSVVTGADGWPSAYLYRAGGQVVRIEKEDALGRRQLMQLKALNPGDDHYGLGCLEAAVGAASVHNRASQRIDALLCPVVEGAPQPAPPSGPPIGTCYLVATGATGAWSGQGGAIACYTAGGWRFISPLEGLTVRSRASGEDLQWRQGAWEQGVIRAQQVRIAGQAVLRERQPAIPGAVGGAVIDSENRAVVADILNALRAHGLIG